MKGCVLLLKNETTPKLNRSQINRVFSSEKQLSYGQLYLNWHRPIGIIMSLIFNCFQLVGSYEEWKDVLQMAIMFSFYWSDLNSFSDRDEENVNIISVQDLAEGWTAWGRWGDCIGTCGYGTHSRERFCLSAGPGASGAGCYGSYVESKPCRHRYACQKIDNIYGLYTW